MWDVMSYVTILEAVNTALCTPIMCSTPNRPTPLRNEIHVLCLLRNGIIRIQNTSETEMN